MWKSGLYKLPLKDMNGKVVEILDPGQLNRDAGPDFFNARIWAGGLVWVGNIEIHRKASDWYLHGHHHDPAYNNVILHIVLEADCLVSNANFETVPSILLDYHPGVYRKYKDLFKANTDLRCSDFLGRVDMSGLRPWLETLLEERNRDKLEAVKRSMQETKGNRQEVMYRMLARAFGQHVNAVPFEMLVRSFPMDLITRYNKRLLWLESLLLGQAGLIPEKSPDYYSWKVRSIYQRLRARHKLKGMDGHLWKFLRLRPMNFPGVRIAQLAWLMHKHHDLFQSLLREDKHLKLIRGLDIGTSAYWNKHFTFGKRSRKCSKKPGPEFLRRLLINAVLPVHYSLEIMSGRQEDFAGWNGILSELPAEDNYTVRLWISLGVTVPDAFSSQALLQLKDNYCKFKRCLSCFIGNQIVQQSSPDTLKLPDNERENINCSISTPVKS